MLSAAMCKMQSIGGEALRYQTRASRERNGGSLRDFVRGLGHRIASGVDNLCNAISRKSMRDFANLAALERIGVTDRLSRPSRFSPLTNTLDVWQDSRR